MTVQEWMEDDQYDIEREAFRRHEADILRAMESLTREELDGGMVGVLGLCAVCGAPVVTTDQPTAVEWEDGRAGYIHGLYDCTDLPRCSIVGMVGEVESRCVLVEGHPNGHLIR